MLTNNYYSLFGMCLTSNDTSTYHPFTTTDGDVKYYRYFSNNASQYVENGLGLSSAGTIASSVNSLGILFCDGTTAPKVSDYTISGKIIKGLTISTIKTADLDEPGTIAKNVLYTITNGNSTPVTISEIAYVYNVYGYAGNSSTLGSIYTLLDRTVLDVPITIEPGSVGQITYTVKLNYPA